MKALHLCAGNMFGGIERLLLTLARKRALCPSIEPSFAACFEGDLAGQLRGSGVNVEILGAIRASRPWTGWFARRRLRRFLDRQRFDAVIAHACWPLAMLGTAVRKASSRPRLILWAHDILSGDHWIERKAAGIEPDLVIANSQVTANSVGKIFPGVQTRVVYAPVERPAPIDRQAVRAQIRKELATPDDAAVIILASRLERWKGHGVLLEALGRLPRESNWICWIAGGAQRDQEQLYLSELQALAARLGIATKVRFLGQRSDVPRLLAAADIHCQPNTGPEPFGIAFVEAMLAGLCVITSQIGAATEILTPQTGLLVEPNNADSLTGALSSMIKDEAARQRLATEAPSRAAELCDPAASLARLFEVIGSNIPGVASLARSPRSEETAV